MSQEVNFRGEIISALEAIGILRRERDAARRERDEARQELAEYRANVCEECGASLPPGEECACCQLLSEAWCERDQAQAELWRTQGDLQAAERDLIERTRERDAALSWFRKVRKEFELSCCNRDVSIKALKGMVRAVEDMLKESILDDLPECLWDPYDEARKLLGCPIQMFPGGYEGSHYHFYDFDPETDTCCACEDYEEDQRHRALDADGGPACESCAGLGRECDHCRRLREESC